MGASDSEYVQEMRDMQTEVMKRESVDQHVHDYPEHPPVEGGYRGVSTCTREDSEAFGRYVSARYVPPVTEKDNYAAMSAPSVVAEAVLADAVRTSAPLPTDSAERKRTPLCTGCLDYFEAALDKVVDLCQQPWNGDDGAQDADVMWCLRNRGRGEFVTATLALLALCLLTDEIDPDAHRDWREVHSMSDLFDMFPAALAAVAQVSWYGNEKHNPGQPLHHARGKSTDHADTIARHYVERGGFDGPMRHTACLAWRCLALLQQELEDAGAPLARGARL
jgi:hypothetical protein